MPSKSRLYLDHPLSSGQIVPLSPDEANYLFAVMRLQAGTLISVFNGRDGEWDGAVHPQGKRGGHVEIVAQTGPQLSPPDLWLLFAPIKKARTDFIVEKATELGVAKIQPVLTDYTNGERFNVDKQIAHAREAAEQCGGTYIPEVTAPVKLAALLKDWDSSRPLWFCDETLLGQGNTHLSNVTKGAVLIGPEGGFSPAERDLLRSLPFATPIALGPRILRAETAAVAALTLWQATHGDWDGVARPAAT